MDDFSAVDKRLMSVEEKIEYQEYTLEKLNEVVFAQQRQLVEMERRLKLLEEKLLVNLPWRDEKGSGDLRTLR